MSNHFNKVTIENFKSIKKIDFDCKRINLFLGEPNVGKSNILEALGLFSAPYSFLNNSVLESRHGMNQIRFAWDQVRYTFIRNLFFFQDTQTPIRIITDKGIAILSLKNAQNDHYSFLITDSEDTSNKFLSQTSSLDNSANLDFFDRSVTGFAPNYFVGLLSNGTHLNIDHVRLQGYLGFTKKYGFNETLFKSENFHNKFAKFLLPSYGSNVFTIVSNNYELADLVGGFFEKYNLELIFVSERNEYVIQRKQGRVVTQLPYDSIADTLQRIIFHLAAIYSNQDSVLIFEEPESHSFPDYIQLLATKIIESESNQFFIATHSPYLVQKLLQGTDYAEIAVNVVDYREHQTLIKPIPNEKIDKMIDRGTDVFFNLQQF